MLNEISPIENLILVIQDDSKTDREVFTKNGYSFRIYGKIIPEKIQMCIRDSPVFGLKDIGDDNTLLFPTLVTPSAILSGKELAKALNFPRKSVSGLPVLELSLIHI